METLEMVDFVPSLLQFELFPVMTIAWIPEKEHDLR